MNRPIIQAGMGPYVSSPFLANKCARHKEVLGTVSGVAAGPIMSRLLQKGDIGGHFRRALSRFPFSGVTERVLQKYFVDGGIPSGQKFRPVPIFGLHPSQELIELSVAATFAFVFLAKEGHGGLVSINFLEKMQRTLVYEIFGAMLAGVDVVTMGAGIPLQIPAVLDAFAQGNASSYRVSVLGSKEGSETICFDPQKYFGRNLPVLKRPEFLPIVSSDVLASVMVSRLPLGAIQGFVVEGHIAGGHNAPPRGKLTLSETGEPVYGARDEADFKKLQSLGIPFWLAGGYASPEGLAKARSLGAIGIQAGKLFAFSNDSGWDHFYRWKMRFLSYHGKLTIRTEPCASPTGFPFKVAQLADTVSDKAVYEARERVCDLCALAVPYQKENGDIGFRCPGEPIPDYLRKGGNIEDTVGVRCLCNGLLTAVGLGNPSERPLFTLGPDVSFLHRLMKSPTDSYTADDAIAYLLGKSAT